MRLPVLPFIDVHIAQGIYKYIKWLQAGKATLKATPSQHHRHGTCLHVSKCTLQLRAVGLIVLTHRTPHTHAAATNAGRRARHTCNRTRRMHMAVSKPCEVRDLWISRRTGPSNGTVAQRIATAITAKCSNEHCAGDQRAPVGWKSTAHAMSTTHVNYLHICLRVGQLLVRKPLWTSWISGHESFA